MNELQEAAERWKAGDYGYSTAGQELYMRDGIILANAYVSDQAAKAAAEAEGATLIDRDTLLARGFRASGEACAWMYTKGLLSVFGVTPVKPHEGEWRYGDTPIPPFSTCSQLDAVIAVLCKVQP